MASVTELARELAAKERRIGELEVWKEVFKLLVKHGTTVPEAFVQDVDRLYKESNAPTT